MASSSGISGGYDIPWIEKYRPTKVSDVVGNVDAVSRLQVIARDGNMPNLILSVNPFSLSNYGDFYYKKGKILMGFRVLRVRGRRPAFLPLPTSFWESIARKLSSN